MGNDEAIKLLRYPAYGLYYVSSLDEAETGGYSYDLVPSFTRTYSGDLQEEIIAALRWAVDRDTLEFEDILPNLPHDDEFMMRFLEITLGRLEVLKGGVTSNGD